MSQCEKYLSMDMFFNYYSVMIYSVIQEKGINSVGGDKMSQCEKYLSMNMLIITA